MIRARCQGESKLSFVSVVIGDVHNGIHFLISILGFTAPLTEMSARSLKMFLESKERPVRKADNLTSICEPIV
jgi:hypothetical protein